MENNSPKLLKIVLTALTLHHFAAIVIHLLPTGFVHSGLKTYSQSYVSPLFDQKWNMFAPKPLTFSSELLVRCHPADAWVAPTRTLTKQVSELPLIHLQKLSSAYSSFATALLEERKTMADKVCTKLTPAECARRFTEYIATSDAFRQVHAIGSVVCPTKNFKMAIHIVPTRNQDKAELLELN